MEAVKCNGCGKFHGYCSELGGSIQRGESQEEEEMIRRSSGQPTNNQSRQGERGQRQRNGLPFLSTKEASFTPMPGKIIAARVEDDNFRPGRDVVAIRIRFKGQDFLLNLRDNNPNLETLCNLYGEDETQWTGKEVMISNEEDNFNGKVWLHIDGAEDTKAPAKKR